MDPLPELDCSDIASAAAYRFIYERVIDRLLNVAAAQGSHDDEYGATYFTVEQITAVVSDYAKEMHLARNNQSFVYQTLVEHVTEAVQGSLLSPDSVASSKPSDWLDGVEIASQAFFEPILAQLLKEGQASNGYINVKNPSAFFAPDLHSLAVILYGEG